MVALSSSVSCCTVYLNARFKAGLRPSIGYFSDCSQIARGKETSKQTNKQKKKHIVASVMALEKEFCEGVVVACVWEERELGGGGTKQNEN